MEARRLCRRRSCEACRGEPDEQRIRAHAAKGPLVRGGKPVSASLVVVLAVDRFLGRVLTVRDKQIAEAVGAGRDNLPHDVTSATPAAMGECDAT